MSTFTMSTFTKEDCIEIISSAIYNEMQENQHFNLDTYVGDFMFYIAIRDASVHFQNLPELLQQIVDKHVR